MTQTFGTPFFGLVGEVTPNRGLTIGVYDNEIRRVVTMVNSGGTDTAIAKGQILVRGVDGTVSALAVGDLVPVEHTLLTPVDPVGVEAEAVGTADGTETVFSLAHAPVVADTLALKVNDAAVTTGFTLDAHRGTITFTVAPENTHTIVADYDYALPADEEAVVMPCLTGSIPLVAEADVTVPKKVGDTNGSAQINVLVKAEVAKDQLFVGAVEWADLDAAVAAKLENWLVMAGIIPADVVR